MSLIAAHHATSGQHHFNFRLPTKYMWPGNPYPATMYFQVPVGGGHVQAVQGAEAQERRVYWRPQRRPHRGSLQTEVRTVWNPTRQRTDGAGPCFWRPPTVAATGQARSEDRKTVWKDSMRRATLCLNQEIKDKNGLVKIQFMMRTESRVILTRGSPMLAARAAAL